MDIGHVSIDDAQIDKRRQQTLLGPELHLLLGISGQLLGLYGGALQHRARVGLPGACEDIDASFQRSPCQRSRSAKPRGIPGTFGRHVASGRDTRSTGPASGLADSAADALREADMPRG